MTMLQDRVEALPRAEIRRRRAVLVLTGLTGAAAVLAVGTASVGGWVVFAVAAGLTLSYLVLLHRSRLMATEREFGIRRSDLDRFLADLSDPTRVPGPASAAEAEVMVPLDAVPAWRQALALVRFLAACAAGWALAPVAFALTLAVGRTPRDTTGQRWLANLEAARDRLRDQSMRTLVVSAAGAASVTALGTVAVMGGSTVASASTITAGAGVGLDQAAGIGLTTSASSTAVTTYTVQAGDTLSSIAARFGTTYQALATANHLSNPNLIYAGTTLTIPGGTGPASGGRAAASGTYTVRAGDTLSSIAARFATTVGQLAAVNGITNPNVIVVGQVLHLSGSAPTRSTTATTPATEASAPITPAASAPAASGAAEAVSVARAQVGKPYEWAGAGPNDFDCSGLVMYAWDAAGVALPHYTVSQYDDTARIGESQLEPGDLVFYDTGSGAQPGHVTMYVGGGQVVTADSPGTDVRVESLTWDGTPMGFGRVR